MPAVITFPRAHRRSEPKFEIGDDCVRSTVDRRSPISKAFGPQQEEIMSALMQNARLVPFTASFFLRKWCRSGGGCRYSTTARMAKAFIKSVPNRSLPRFPPEFLQEQSQRGRGRARQVADGPRLCAPFAYSGIGNSCENRIVAPLLVFWCLVPGAGAPAAYGAKQAMIKPSLQLQSNGRQIGMGDWLGLVFEINTARAETRMFRVARVQLALRAAKRCQH
jgi:hypothetical protein